MIQQLLREWPPGYGGVERVAHALAEELGGAVFCLRPPRGADPWPVGYPRWRLPSIAMGRLLWPLPSRILWELLGSPQPLLAHLPCPTVLALLLLARLLRPSRPIRVVWHAFVDPRPGLQGLCEHLYQAAALRLVRGFPVCTTSPPLRQALLEAGLPPGRLTWLACSLPPATEAAYRAMAEQRSMRGPCGHVIVIGRLDSYKRIDWLLEAVALCPAVNRLDVLGEGPQRPALEALAQQLLGPHQRAFFHGRVSELRKRELLAQADVLVLPADRCNEAFGIVQLEAMASGIPALAFQLPRSGMHWVSALPACPWSGQPAQLPSALQLLLTDPPRHRLACQQAQQRYQEQFASAIWRRRCRQVFATHG